MNRVTRAIDVGYGQTKFTYDVNENGQAEFRSFASIVKKAAGNNQSLIKGNHNIVIKVKDAFYEVGESVVDDHNVGILSEGFSKSNEYQALVLGAISMMRPVKIIDTLVLGLPVQFINTKSEALIKLFVGKHTLNNNKTVLIKNVEVIAQPLGGYYAWAENKSDEDVKLRTLIIDPGFYTFDYIVVKNGADLTHLNGSFPGGLSLLLEFVAKQISNKYQIDYTNLRSIEEGIMSGTFRLYGKVVDLKPLLKPFQKETVNIIQKIVNQLEDGRDIDNIVLVGGGSRMFFGAINSIFKKHSLTLLDEPMYANVRGYQLYPETLVNAEEQQEDVA